MQLFSLRCLIVLTPVFLLPVAVSASLLQPEPVLAQTTTTNGRTTAATRLAEGDRLLNLGVEQASAGQFREALQSLTQALAIYQEIENHAGESRSLTGLGVVLRNLGQYQQAISLYQQSLAIDRRLGDRASEGNTLGNLGVVYRNMGDYRQAMDLFEQALSIARDVGDRALESRSLANLGNVHNNLEDYQQAISFFEQALPIDREVGNRREEGRTLGNLGVAYLALGDHQRAIDFFQQYLAIAREVSDRVGQEIALDNLSVAYNDLGQYLQAIDVYKQQLEIAREIGDRAEESRALGRLGDAYFNLGQYQPAIDFYQQQLVLARASQQTEEAILYKLALAYDNLGRQHQQTRQFSEALQSFQQALEIYRNSNFRAAFTQESRQQEAAVLGNTGLAYGGLEQYERAIDFFEQALAITRDIDERQVEAIVLSNMGDAYYLLERFERAIEVYEQWLTLAPEIDDRQSESRILGNLGSSYDALEDYDRAIEFLEQSLAIQREISDLPGTALSLNNLGNAYRSLEQFDRAIEFYEQALAIRHNIDDRQGEADALNNLGATYFGLKQYARAIEYYEQFLAIRRDVDDSSEARPGQRRQEGIVLRNLGLAYRILHDYQRAIDFHQQALAIARELGDRSEEATALGNLGVASSALGNYQQAIDFYQQALTINREIEDRVGEGTSLGNLGTIYSSLGQYQQAIEVYQQAIAIAREIGDRDGEGGALNNLGFLYSELGRVQQAVDLLQKALAIARETDDRQGEALALSNLSNIHPNLFQAHDFHRQHIDIVRDLGDREEEARAWMNVGLWYYRAPRREDISIVQGEINLRVRSQEIINAYQQALTIYRELGLRQEEGIALNNLGSFYSLFGLHQQAISFHEQSLIIARELGDRDREASALQHLGSTYRSLSRFADAEKALFEAIAILESLRESDLKDTDKVSLFDTQVDVYSALQNLLIDQGKTEEALVVAERGRARVLVESLAARASERLEQQITSNAPDLAEIRRIAQQQNATLVTYSVNDTGDPVLYVWVVQPTGEIAFQSVELESGYSEIEWTETETGGLSGESITSDDRKPSLEELVTTTRQALNVRSRDDATVVVALSPEALARKQLHQQAALQTLYTLLINPIAQHLPTNPGDRIIFIPHQSLFLVPFPALMDANGDYLIQHHTILTAPSIQALSLTRQQRNPTTTPLRADDLLVVGNPLMPAIWNPLTGGTSVLSSLPGTEQETLAIQELYGTRPLWGERASEAAVVAQMPNARVIHLATHGLLEYGNPEDSGVRDLPGAIALAPGGGEDGLLTSAEIFEMTLKADLVVLSACDTGRGRITGDGVIGLSRAFMQAGVPSLLVSLWKVPDEATAFLMTQFYENWRTNPDKAKALRQAMLTTLEQYPDPLNWAAFTLIGEAE